MHRDIKMFGGACAAILGELYRHFPIPEAINLERLQATEDSYTDMGRPDIRQEHATFYALAKEFLIAERFVRVSGSIEYLTLTLKGLLAIEAINRNPTLNLTTLDLLRDL